MSQVNVARRVLADPKATEYLKQAAREVLEDLVPVETIILSRNFAYRWMMTTKKRSRSHEAS